MSINKKAFTLIELLVVIAIIALLLAIITPALSKAKDLAKRVVCSSNEHQLGVAFQGYAADYRKYPHRVHWGYWPFGGHAWYDAQSRTPTVPLPAGFALLYEGRYLGMEEKSFRFMYCPAAKGHISYEQAFVWYQMNKHPDGKTYNPNWPNSLNYNALYTAYSYWGGFANIAPTNQIDPVLSKVLALGPTDSGSRVLVSDLIFTFVDSDRSRKQSHLLNQGWTSHVRKNIVQGGASLYNDGSARWMAMEKMQQDYKKHSWNWTAYDLWF
jgi:prepilin-type N-terminal cleavage/methylation domain-containing protein